MLKEGRRYEVDFYEAIDFIENQATQWSIENKQIFRGIARSERDGASIIEPASHTRTAVALSDDVYNIMIDNMPSWEKYPKRHLSVYGSFVDKQMKPEQLFKWIESDFEYNDFGYVNFLIPEDGAKLAVCETSDLRTSLYAGHNEMNIDNRKNSMKGTWIGNLPKIFKGLNKEYFKEQLDMSKWEDIEKMSKHITTDMLKDSIENGDTFEFRFGYLDNIAESMEKLGYATVYDFLNKGFAPDNNRMELIEYTKDNINKLTAEYDDDREIWTESDCLIVNPKLMPEILKELNG
jgi:hypothetical protein